MEISEREYFELKEQVRALQEKVNGIEKPKRDFVSLVSELPINAVRNTVDDYPDFKYFRNTTDAWRLFVQLAKIVHAESYKYYMSTTYPGSYKPYIRTIGKHEAPKRITDMTDEQITVSIQMLNELIPIYNKYFKQMHEYVLYSDTNDGQYRKIYVEKEREE